VSLVCVDELQLLKDIEKLIKRAVPQETIAGFEPDPNARPEPILRRGQGGGGRQPRQEQGQRQGQPRGQRQGQGQGQGQPKREGAPRGGQRGSGAASTSASKTTADKPKYQPHAKPQNAKPAHARNDAPRQQDKPRNANPGALLGGGGKPRSDAPRRPQSRAGQHGK
jgi:ATP-dependent RNA helicase RhlE